MPERRSRGRFAWLGVIGPQRLVLGGVVLVLIAVFGLLLFAWYSDQVRPRRELALSVGDISYSMEYFAKRYKQAVEDPANLDQLRTGLLSAVPEQTADRMERDAILLQRAETLGVTAGQNEIDREMLVRNNVPVITDTPEGAEAGPDDSFTVTQAMRRTIQARLQQYDYTLEEFREIYHAALLQDKVQNYFKAETPERAPQVRIRLLQFPNQSDARIAIEKIKSGESSFTDLAETVSLDQAGKGRGGARDWLTRGILPPAVEEAAFSLPLNTLSDPIDAGDINGWILIEVLDRSDERDVTDTVRRQLADQRYTAWLAEQRQTLDIRNALTPAKIRWAYQWSNPTVPSSLLQQGTQQPGQLPTNQIPITPPGSPVPAATPAGTP